eukprot:gnl/MRDRNA2_/MRDRNA2_27858_c0_seq1.p1 gnl/MRDRNA2_/MRDRNA2_27858_c0~~gnl/MRDRNA2_/MRDRNA2_27858_c0_seq1.p1  ORF type:complete len:292 (-),score=16.67 gnl/MRDRNA2_/MRDRNA2_27858_c0_seq1:34-909(-)
MIDCICRVLLILAATANRHACIDTMTDRKFVSLLDRASKSLHSGSTNVDTASLGKPDHLSVAKRTAHSPGSRPLHSPMMPCQKLLLPINRHREHFFLSCHLASDEDVESRGPLPGVVVFDLDACCWFPEISRKWAGPPFTYDRSANTCTDQGGVTMRLLGNTSEVWGMVRDLGIPIAIASRGVRPSWSHEIMGKFMVGSGETMSDAVNSSLVEIYMECKTQHLQEISRKSGVGLESMLFFDDAPENVRNGSSIGVTSILTPNGVTKESWLEGLAVFRDNARARSKDVNRGL